MSSTTTIFSAICSAISLIAVALITTRSSRRDKRLEERAGRREKESRLSMSMMNATCALSIVTAKAVTGQHTNGDVEAAMTTAADAQRHYTEFLADTAANAMRSD